MIDIDRLTNHIHADLEGVRETRFPLEVFPDTVQKIVYDLVHYENFNLEFIAAIVLSVYAAGIGNSCYVNIKGAWVSCSALYMLLVGRPGLGKTPPLGYLYTPIREFDEQLLDKARKDYEFYHQQQENKGCDDTGLIEKPRLRQTIISDFTQEAMLSIHYDNPRGIVLYVDEVISLFNSVKRYSAKSNLIEDLLSAYSGQPLKVVRKSEAFPLLIPKPCINLIGGIQTDLLDEIFKKEYVANGLLDRFLFVFPKNKKIPKWQLGVDETCRPDIMGRWTTIIRKVMDINCPIKDDGITVNPNVLKMADDAKALFYTWFNGIIDEVNAIDDDNAVESRKMKVCCNAARLALILQVMRWSVGECRMDYIDIESVKGAIRLITYFEDSYQRVKDQASLLLPQFDNGEWIHSLNEHFTTAEAIAAGMTAGVSRRTVFNTLDRLCQSPNPIIMKSGHGIYDKIVNACTTAPCTSALSGDKGTLTDNKPEVQECKVHSATVMQEGGCYE